MRPAGGEVAVDLPCVRCRYNLRGAPQSGNCPECGAPIKETLAGLSAEERRREGAADAVRSYGKSFAFGIPLGLFMVGCLGPPVALVALIGSGARLVALRNLAREADGGIDAADLRRARALAVAELAAGAPALLMLVEGMSWAIGPTADETVRLALAGLWFGTMALGTIAGSMLLDRIASRLPVEFERPTVIHALALGAAPVVMLGMILSAAGIPTSLVVLVRLAGAAAWGTGAAMLAFRGSMIADELRAAPGARRAQPRDAEPGNAGPRERPDPRARAQARHRLEDDSPIPLD